MSPTFSPEHASLVPLQTRLASQAQSLAQTGGRLSEAAKTGGSGAEEAAASQLVKQFSQAVETTQQLSALLSSHNQGAAGPSADASAKVAERLRLVVQVLYFRHTCLYFLYMSPLLMPTSIKPQRLWSNCLTVLTAVSLEPLPDAMDEWLSQLALVLFNVVCLPPSTHRVVIHRSRSIYKLMLLSIFLPLPSL